MESLINLVIYALATFRLSQLVVLDSGPFDVFYYLRGWAFRPRENNNPFISTIKGILACAHCGGIYFAFLFGIVYYLNNPILKLLVWIFAVAGLQSILNVIFNRKAEL